MELYIELSMARKFNVVFYSFMYLVKKGDMYNTMNLDHKQYDKINVLFTKFKEYCKPKQNIRPSLVYFLFPVPIFSKTEAGGR